MTTHGPLHGPDDDEWRELTPDEQEKLRHIADRVSKINIPKIMSDEVSEVIAKLNATVTQQFDTVLEPLIEANNAMVTRNLGLIDSDFFKTHAATQAQFAKISADLTKNLDFAGISDAINMAASQLLTQQSTWLKDLGPTLDRIWEKFYPPNLRGIDDLKLHDVQEIVMADAIALYGVPGAAVAEAIIRAESAAERREILEERWRAVSADCRATLEGLTSNAVAAYVPFGVAALDALDNGHIEAAQALTGSLIDTVLTAYLGKNQWKYKPGQDYTPGQHAKDGEKKTTDDHYYELPLHQFLATAPMLQVYQQYRVNRGDRVPVTFNRHATAHTVSPEQYTRPNAVQGLLFVTSLLYFIDEQAPEPEAT